MTTFRFLSLAALITAATGATASSFVASTDAVVGALVGTIDATSDISSGLGDDKVVRAARDDAALFVATAGEIRGVHLQAALQHIRQQAPQLIADDLQLAQAILSL